LSNFKLGLGVVVEMEKDRHGVRQPQVAMQFAIATFSSFQWNNDIYCCCYWSQGWNYNCSCTGMG